MTENLLLFSKLNNANIELANRIAGLLISTELLEKFNANNKIIADIKKKNCGTYSLHPGSNLLPVMICLPQALISGFSYAKI